MHCFFRGMHDLFAKGLSGDRLSLASVWSKARVGPPTPEVAGPSRHGTEVGECAGWHWVLGPLKYAVQGEVYLGFKRKEKYGGTSTRRYFICFWKNVT